VADTTQTETQRITDLIALHRRTAQAAENGGNTKQAHDDLRHATTLERFALPLAERLDRTERERDRLALILRRAVDLWREHMDTDAACRFDHHGGCQAHGYLRLDPGERCPVGAVLEEARAALEAPHG